MLPASQGCRYGRGAWHVISLNSNLRLTEFAAQLAWLKADLDQHKTHCTLAYWHHPVYSSGGHGDYDFMLTAWQALVAADADLALVAHDHDYERFAPQDGNGRRDALPLVCSMPHLYQPPGISSANLAGVKRHAY